MENLYKIKSIEISGIWGQTQIKTNFFKDVNIFIGINGTGKTTFLNIIEAILIVDVEQIMLLSFNEVIIILERKGSKRKITVKKKIEEINYSGVEYHIGRKKFTLPLIREIEFRGVGRLHPRIRNEIRTLKSELIKYISLCWLSVHREVSTYEEIDSPYQRESREKNTIDQRLNDLMRRLTIYQLQLESESSKLSNKFREQVFELMLYNIAFDEIILEKIEQVNPEAIKRQLSKAYKDLGLASKETQEKIEKHTTQIGLAIEKIEQVKKNKDLPLRVNDVTPLSLLKRTLSMITISSKFDEQKKEIFKPIETYIKILSDFVPDKLFKLDTESSGELKVFLSNKGQVQNLPIKQLSSGEKQLIIFLTEALLQKKGEYIFLADEPELSLHINWQRKILTAIKDLNINSQIIVATHSPEIAGQWRNRIINMENISKHE